MILYVLYDLFSEISMTRKPMVTGEMLLKSSEIPGKVGKMVFQAEQILCKNKIETEVMIE